MKIDLLDSRLLLSDTGEDLGCGGIQYFLAGEANDDLFAEAQARLQDLFAEAQAHLKETPYKWGHFSNAATLLRSSTLPLYEWAKGSVHPYANALNIALWGLEGIAYFAEYWFHSDNSDKIQHDNKLSFESEIESRQAIQLKDEAFWGKTLTTIWLIIWAIEATYCTLGSTYLKELLDVQKIERTLFHTVAPAISLIMANALRENFNTLQEQKMRAAIALRITEHMGDDELSRIGTFISNAQEADETRYLITCDLLKFAGNMAALGPSFTWFRYWQDQPSSELIKTLSNTSVFIGTIGYSLYGIWQATEWAWDKGTTWWARHQAAIEFLGGNNEKAESTLLESDPEFIVNRLLERLDTEKLENTNVTMIYLNALGISTGDIKALRAAEECNTKARQYLATQLKIAL